MPKPTGNQHWSASRFMLFEQCPRKYQERYVDGVVTAPSLAMLFGHTVHTALEVLLQGHRGACLVCAARHVDHSERLDCAKLVYYRSFDQMHRSLQDEGIEAGGLLYLEGLRMLDQVNVLSLNSDGRSQSERWFTIPNDWPGHRPVVGAVDLWSPPWSRHGAVIWDFKTTVGSWSADRAKRERWQPMLYSWAYLRAYDVLPTFKYLVLNRATGDITIFDRTWSSRGEWWSDFADVEFHAEEIAEAVMTGDFTCTRQHGSCLECGEPYFHEHVCRTPRRATVKLSRKLVEAS